MNLGEARTELQARGFDYLTSTRCNAYLNRAIAAIAGHASWPWLEATASGTAPLTITDLRAVLACVDTTTQAELAASDRRLLVSLYTTVTDTGSPEWWYRTGLTQISVYPANTTDTIEVRYIAHEAELTSDASSPLLPARHHNVWVDRAALEAYSDSDNFDAAGALKAKIDGELLEMRRAYLIPNLDRAWMVQSRRGHEGF